MVTIIGSGMGEHSLERLNIDFLSFDRVLCDISYKESYPNLLKLRFNEIKEYIFSNYERENILYVVGGSPLFFSAGTLIANRLPKEMVKIINNVSTKEYMMQKFCIGFEEIEAISLHGRKHIDLSKFLTNTYTLVLCDKESLDKIRRALAFIEPQTVEITIGYKLGYKDEIIEQIALNDVLDAKFNLEEPYVILIKRLFAPQRSICEDGEFETERGMITKKYKRHFSLQNLDLLPNQIMWDIGAGSGSCGIEAYKRYKSRVVFFEKNRARVENIKKNLQNHFVVDARLCEGNAVDFFESLEENPQRIFVGGGGEEIIEKLSYLYDRLERGGVMLINIVSLKHLSQIILTLDKNDMEYEVISFNYTTHKDRLKLIEPQRELFQIKVVK